MLTENRLLTAEELSELHPILEKLNVKNTREILRFVDTKLDKIYDVYLVEIEKKKRILKQLGERRFDKAKYDTYFAGYGFAVPEIFDTVSAGEKDYVLMEMVEGIDARGCSEDDAAKIGVELAKIQRHYLQAGGHTESAEYYWNRYLEKYYEKIKMFFPDVDEAWEHAKQRFYGAPQTLVHDDLLPINVLLAEERPWIIDWEIAGVYPYFLDLARFAYVNISELQTFFISKESAKAFLDAYYDEMIKNEVYTVSREDFDRDVVISALYQYIMFQEYEKPLEEVQDTMDFRILKEILGRLHDEYESV